MSLSRNVGHDYPKDKNDKGYYECSRCGKFSKTKDDDSWCVGMNKRSSLSSSKRLKKGAGLSRSKGLNKVSPNRREKRKRQGLDTPFKDWIKQQDCLIDNHECKGPIDPAHVKNVGQGYGDWLENGDGNLNPLCRFHHSRSENAVGWSEKRFEDHYGVDLLESAKRYGERFKDN